MFLKDSAVIRVSQEWLTAVDEATAVANLALPGARRRFICPSLKWSLNVSIHVTCVDISHVSTGTRNVRAAKIKRLCTTFPDLNDCSG